MSDEVSVIETLASLAQQIRTIIGVIGVLLGSSIGAFAISRRVKDNFIRDALDQIEEHDRHVHANAIRILERYGKIGDNVIVIPIEDGETLLQECNSLLNESLNASSRVANLAFLLKWLVQKTLRLHRHYYNSTKISVNILSITLHAIDRILLFTSRRAAYPSFINLLFATKRVRLYNPQIRQFVTHHWFKTFRFVNIGVHFSPLYAEAVSLQNEVNSLRDPVLSLAFYRVVQSPLTISVILALNNIYFPPIIQSGRFDTKLNDYWHLALVAFHIDHQIGSDSKKIVTFYYSTDREGLGIAEQTVAALKLEDARDGFLVKTDSILSGVKFRFERQGIISTRVEWENLQQYTKIRIRKFRKRLRKEKRRVRRESA